MSNEARANHEEFLYRSQDEARGKREELSNEPQGNHGKLYTEPRANPENFSNEQLVARIQVGENEADNMLLLWQQTKRFISTIAKKYIGHAEIEDLEQEGYLALCAAVEKYNTSQGVPFINYAAYWMRQYMTRYIQNFGQCVRIPVHAHEDIHKYKKLMSKAALLYGRELTEAEISRCMGISRESVRQIKYSVRMGQIQSLDAPIAGTDNLTVGDTVAAADQEEDKIQELDRQAMKSVLWGVVEELEDKQREVIIYRYRENMTLKDIGEAMGVSTERVRQIQNKAMRYLRNPNRSDKLRQYHEEYLSAASYRHVGVREYNHSWMSEVEREVFKGLEWAQDWGRRKVKKC